MPKTKVCGFLTGFQDVTKDVTKDRHARKSAFSLVFVR